MLTVRRNKNHTVLITCGQDRKIVLYDQSFNVLDQFVEKYPIKDISYIPEIDALAIALCADDKTGLVSIRKLEKLSVQFKVLTENTSGCNTLQWDTIDKILLSGHIDAFLETNKLIQDL